MGKTNQFDNILNEALDRLLKGQDIQSILALYPEEAEELEPLLRAAQMASRAADIQPRPEFRQRAANEFQAAIWETPEPRGAWHSFRWSLRWVVPITLILVLLLGGGGTVLASSGAMPDSPLYSVKLAKESVQLAFTFSNIGKAELNARFANERVQEIIQMAEKGKTDLVEQVTERMDHQLMAVADLTGNSQETYRADANKGLMAVPSGLTSPNATVPPAATPAPTTTTTTASPTETSANFTTTVNQTPVTVSNSPPAVTEPPATTDNFGNIYPGDGVSLNTESHTVGTLSREDRLRLEMNRQFQDNMAALEAQLAKAPESLKPALEKAMEILYQDYLRAINNLAAG